MTFDVVVLGGGVAGLAFARHLQRARPGLRIGLVDAGTLPADRSRSKVGESATEASSWYLATRLGLADHLEREQLKKLGLRFFLPGETFADRPELGPMQPAPGFFSVPFDGVNPTTWQLHRGRLETSLLDAIVADGAMVRAGVRARVTFGAPHRVDLDGERWTARWLIDASGGAGALPVGEGEELPLGHHAQAAWLWVPRRIDVDRFADRADFRARVPADLRWRSTVHLVGRGYWVWIIALADGSTSVGVVSDPAFHPLPNTVADTYTWIAAHEPELGAALRDAGAPTDFGARRWESRVRRTVVSDERWAVAGDTAGFLDPLFSSGLDLLTVGNELTVPLVLAELDGVDIGRAARRASALYGRVTEQYLSLYQGSYQVMGHPRAMMAKLVWDLGVYFGFLAIVTRSGRLAEEDFMTRVGHVGRGVATLQARTAAVLVAWASHPPTAAHGAVDQGACTPLLALLQRMRDAEAGHELALLAANLRILEQVATGVFRAACADLGLDAPTGPINPYAASLDPTAWERDGLCGGAHPVEIEGWVAGGLDPVWLRH